jgi:hypothetical protein
MQHAHYNQPMEWRERIGRSAQDLPSDQRGRFEHNVALAIRLFMEGGQRVVPIKPEETGTGWQGCALELWEGPNRIRRQFEIHIHQNPVPGIGRQISHGAIMPDGSVFGGADVPTRQTVGTPVVAAPPPPKPEPAAPTAAKTPTKKIAAAIARAKAALAKGAKRDAVLKRLRDAGIETTEI